MKASSCWVGAMSRATRPDWATRSSASSRKSARYSSAGAKACTVTDALERKLYIIRKESGHAIQALKLAHGKEFYVPSMSARTVVYKGMLLANQVGSYYQDLQDPRVVSALALVHQRFSTNTFPTWDLATRPAYA